MTMQDIPIMIADDNLPMRTMVSAMLRACEFRTIFQCADGREAAEFVRERPVDIAIIDLKMPRLDGLAFTRWVRTGNEVRDPGLPIIMLTGHTDLATLIAARDAGVTEILSKPLCTEQLVRRINAVIMKPRPFVMAPRYAGPDRRRRERISPDLQRRATDAGRKDESAG